MRTSRILTIAVLAATLTTFGAACGPDNGDTDGGTDAGTDGGSTSEGVDFPGTCGDGVDNDNDGFTDCDEFACSADPVCEAPASLTIKDIRDVSSQWHPSVGATVHLSDVIVTVVKPRTAGTQTYWDAHIQMAEGGPFSAIALRGSPVEIAIGDSLSIEGTYEEYFEFSQVLATTVTVNSSGNALPAPEVVAPADLVTGSAQSEQWESVLVQVNDVQVVEPVILGDDNKEHGDFEVTGGLIVGNTYWHDYGDSVQQAGDEFQSIVGVMQFSWSVFRLQPRFNEDLTFADGTNPGPGEAVELPIQAIQDESHADHPRENSAVRIVDAVVTAVQMRDTGGVRAFVVQQGTGAYSGVWVYVPAYVTVDTLAVGDTVSFDGEYVEYYEMTEINLSAAPTVGTPGTVPEPELITDPTVLTAAATAEPLEGVLVKLQPETAMTVDSAPDNYGVWSVGGVAVDDVFYAHPAVQGQTITSITGIVDYSFQLYHVLPRSADDIAE